MKIKLLSMPDFEGMWRGFMDKCYLYVGLFKSEGFVTILKLITGFVVTVTLLLLPFGAVWFIGYLIGASGFWPWFAVCAIAAIVGIGPYIFYAALVVYIVFQVMGEWLK